MKILVTGGAGYVGSSLIPALLHGGHEVDVLDWFLFCGAEIFYGYPRLRLYKGDIRDRTLIKELTAEADAVIHLAAMSNDPSGELNKKLTRDINHTGTVQLLDIAAENRVKRFIYASSASVYGASEASRVVETLAVNPQTAYAEAKATSELYVLKMNSADFTTVCVRPATLHGYSPRLRLDLTANIFTAQALSTNRITVFGGDQHRPNLALADMIRLYELLLAVPGEIIGGEIFNIVESNRTVLEIAETVQHVVAPHADLVRTQSADKRSYRLCGDKAAQILGFGPNRSLENSVADLAAYLCRWSMRQFLAPQYRNIEWLKLLGTQQEVA